MSRDINMSMLGVFQFAVIKHRHIAAFTRGLILDARKLVI